MPLVEIQIKNTATQADDYVVVTTNAPCRARIVNTVTDGEPTFTSNIPVTLRNFRESSGGALLFSSTSSGAGSSLLNVVLPAGGGWANFYVRGASPSAADKDVAVEMVENRPSGDGIVLGRRALMVTATPPLFSNAVVEIQINNSETTIDDYVTWSPTVARIRRVSAGTGPDVAVTLRNLTTTTGGQLAFASTASLMPHTNTATASTLTTTLPSDGSWREFYIAGQFQRPSTRDKDAVIEARGATGVRFGREAVMVRIRKNANDLAIQERDRFLAALARLNSSTFNLYSIFQDIHSVASGQAHGGPAFLPWHRTFVLRIERELQAIDPSVALPFWRFDQPAPNVFHPDFMGGPPAASSSLATFSATNPLATWTISGFSGVRRRPVFAPTGVPSVNNELETLALGSVYASFRSMEGNPHDPVHGLTGGSVGWLSSVPSAVQDPLFFLLHCNVDRLWAKWQWVNNRWDPTSLNAYSPQGAFPGVGPFPLGHYADDTMWPWNGETGPGGPSPWDDRPLTAPGGPIPQIQGFILGPVPEPRPRDVNDYGSNRSLSAVNQGLGFAYVDVRYR